MKVLFVYSLNFVQSSEKPMEFFKDIQLGISYISSFLKKHGHETKLIILSRMNKEENFRIIERTMKSFNAKVICFTSVASEFSFITTIASYFKENFSDSFLVIGGPHASLMPEDTIKHSFDAVCIGAGEYPVLELLKELQEKKEPKAIKNFWFKNSDGSIIKNSTRPFISDLDQFPFPDRKIWKEWIEEAPGASHSILLGRGCPFQCSYCCNHALKKLATGSYVRFRSPENIIKEVKFLNENYLSKKSIFFEIETFAANSKWAFDVCDKLT